MSAFYTSFKNNLMKGNINLETDAIKAVLIDYADYNFSGTHEFFSEVPAGAVVGTPVALTGQAVELDRFLADNLLFPSVTGDQFEGVLFYLDSGLAASSRLMLIVDNDGGLSVTPTGVGINIVFSTSPAGIFRL